MGAFFALPGLKSKTGYGGSTLGGGCRSSVFSSSFSSIAETPGSSAFCSMSEFDFPCKNGGCTPSTRAGTPPKASVSFLTDIDETCVLEKSRKADAVFEGVLLKRSRYLRSWRRRLVRVVDCGKFWQLTTWDDSLQRQTGEWNVERALPYIDVSAKNGFVAMMELNGVFLASDTESGALAMEELATIFNGRFMRRGGTGASRLSVRRRQL